jgi:hypothetical protein
MCCLPTLRPGAQEPAISQNVTSGELLAKLGIHASWLPYRHSGITFLFTVETLSWSLKFAEYRFRVAAGFSYVLSQSN